ncbi:MAG: hypothetical protein AAFN12_19390, partial [Cyanobacteria bacterium J06560_2]
LDYFDHRSWGEKESGKRQFFTSLQAATHIIKSIIKSSAVETHRQLFYLSVTRFVTKNSKTINSVCEKLSSERLSPELF